MWTTISITAPPKYISYHFLLLAALLLQPPERWFSPVSGVFMRGVVGRGCNPRSAPYVRYIAHIHRVPLDTKYYNFLLLAALVPTPALALPVLLSCVPVLPVLW